MAGQRRSIVQSVERAIAILRSFTQEKPQRGVNELSRELGLHKSTVSRLMLTLEQGGLLWRDPETDRYRLGVELIGMAAQVVSYMDVREAARPLLRQLADTCQETVNLAVLDAEQVYNLEQMVPQARQVKNIGRPGRRMCPHCTAAGKVLLAFLPSEELERVLPERLDKFTPHTITDPDRLRQELARVRQQGYAVAQEELEKGLNVVAAPIYNHEGRVEAAVSVAGPSYRLPADLLPQMAALVVNAARQVSQELGYRGS
ncbi:MAG: IclR family transcriptional regulator [Chloroflexota bacterium]